MSTVLYQVTRDVRHLVVWTSDKAGLWHASPICGSPAQKGRIEVPGFMSAAESKYAMRRPICKRCVRTAQKIATAVQS